MRKLIILASICVLMTGNILAQEKSPFNINAGISLFAGWKHNSGTTFLPAITLSPGLKFIQAKDFTMVLDLPVTAGWNFKHGTYFGIDAPLMLNFHFGSAAANNDKSKFGIVTGAGIGYTNFANYEEIISYTGNTHSLTAHTEFWGYRFKLGVSLKAEPENSVVPSVVINYGRSINVNGGNVLGLSLLPIFMNDEVK